MTKHCWFKQAAFSCLAALVAVVAFLASSHVDSRAAVLSESPHDQISTGSENWHAGRAAEVSAPARPLAQKRTVELRLDDLPDYPAAERRSSTLREVSSSRSLVIDDGELARIYLPIVMKGAVPPPAPTLYGIDNPNDDGFYAVNWSAVDLATNYTLQEDDNAGFSSPDTVFSGLGITKSFQDKPIGIYYYRVRAENAAGSSAWSETQSVAVTVVSQLICETHNFGEGGHSYLISPNPKAWTFTAEHTMMAERIETLSNMKSLFVDTVHIQFYVNDVETAHWYVFVSGNAWSPYTTARNESVALNQGDTLKIKFWKFSSDPETGVYVGWGNYVKLCGR